MRTLAFVFAVGALAAPHTVELDAQSNAASSWTQWGGPTRNFIVNTTGLAETWPEAGPPVIWSRPLGPGHSAILADEGRIYTMYRAGNGRAKQGPWESEETVIAMDAATGKTLWEHKYPSRREDFSFGAGPHSTPCRRRPARRCWRGCATASAIAAPSRYSTTPNPGGASDGDADI